MIASLLWRSIDPNTLWPNVIEGLIILAGIVIHALILRGDWRKTP